MLRRVAANVHLQKTIACRRHDRTAQTDQNLHIVSMAPTAYVCLFEQSEKQIHLSTDLSEIEWISATTFCSHAGDLHGGSMDHRYFVACENVLRFHIYFTVRTLVPNSFATGRVFPHNDRDAESRRSE